MQPTKLNQLEALRGIAAIVVLVHHFMLGFMPSVHGLLTPDQPQTLFGTPAFALVNGSAAVVTFFVLSDFVLTISIFRSRQLSRIPIAALKRFPRLALTIIIANTLYGAAMALSLFANQDAAKIIPSLWLGWYYNWTSEGYPEVLHAASEGVTNFFVRTVKYNGNIWTMWFELWGSLISLGCAGLLVLCQNRTIRRIVLILCWLAATLVNAYFGSFIVGVATASAYVRSPKTTWPRWSAIAAAPLLALVFGYHESLISGRLEGYYTILNPLIVRAPLLARVVIHSFGAGLLILLLLRIPLLARSLSGRVGRALGFLSFAIYLMQMLVICSLSSWVYLALAAAPEILRIAACFAATLLGTLLLALPLAILDRWWVNVLHKVGAGLPMRLSVLRIGLR